MINITEAYGTLLSQLEEIAATSENRLQLAERSYHQADTSLQLLKRYILSHNFSSRDDEIRFFKEEKPRFLKELIYYRELYHIEAQKPVGNAEVLSEYYRRAIERIRSFFERNQMIYIYYRMGTTAYDAHYFLRDTESLLLLPEAMPEMDTRFCTVASYKLGKIMAYEKLNAYLLRVLENPIGAIMEQDGPPLGNRPDVTWTDSKAQLIEIGYSLFSKGAVNNGKADIKLIMAALEYTFNISLGNYYGVFQQNIRIRKKNRTAYLSQLEGSLNAYMDDLDENPRANVL